MHRQTVTLSGSASRPLLSAKGSEQGTTQVVTVVGEMDVSSVAQVEKVIDRALSERPETLLLDLSEIEFCDSSGVHLVVRTQHRASRSRTRFRVIPPTGVARRVFDLCHIEECVTFVSADGTGTHPEDPAPV